MNSFALLGLALLSQIQSFRHLNPPLAPDDPALLGCAGHYRNGYVTVNDLNDAGRPWGTEIILHRKGDRIRAKYFASGNIANRYLDFKSSNDVVIGCCGGFSDGSRVPVGLTIDAGVVINRRLNSEMDGLVIVYATGGIVVSDLDHRTVTVGGINRGLDLRNYDDLSTFLQWAKDNQATIFQTQLLAFDNALLINPDLSDVYAKKVELRERRFLVIGKEKYGDVVHEIISLTETSEYLGKASQKIYNYLIQKRNLDLIAMLNLDVGMCNFAEFYNDYGNKMDACTRAPTGVSDVSNLLIYHYGQF